MFKKILFPVDLSEASSKVCPYVNEMAEKFGAQIHALHVVQVNLYYTNLDMAASYLGDFESAVKKGAEKKFNAFLSANFPGKNVVAKMVTGQAKDEVIQYIKNEGMDLVVMGHSSTGLERAIFGSVAGHVVKHSPVPVMVISPDLLKA
jgi:nucleotide-binding universal stress UspA family protein